MSTRVTKRPADEERTMHDADNFREAVLQGLRSIDAGHFAELENPAALQRYFGDISGGPLKRYAISREARTDLDYLIYYREFCTESTCRGKHL